MMVHKPCLSVARATLIVTITFGIFGVSGARVAHAAPPPAPDEELNSKGVSLRMAGDNKGALPLFQQAYELTHSARATAQLGLVHQALGRWDLAEPLVARAIQSKGDPWIKKYESELTKALVTIREHIAHIELVSDPPQTEVIVNGSPVGRLPLSEPVPVVVGQVDIELRAPGYRNAIRTVTVKPFAYERVFVRLQKEGSEPVAVVTTAKESPHADVAGAGAAGGASDNATSGGGHPTDQSSAGVSPRTVIKWTSLGLAGVGVGTGLVASVIFSSNSSSFRSHNPECLDMDGLAVDAGGKPVPDCQPWLSNYKTARTWQIVGFAAAGVFAATWLVLQLTESPEPSTTSGRGARSDRSYARSSWACAPSLVDPGVACALRF